jgi:FMN-dependent NADH-azoreductase
MKTLLMVNSSPRSNSVSRKLTRHFANEWKAKNSNGRIVDRDLSDGAVPFLNEAWIEAAYTPEVQRTESQRGLLRLSDTLIDEVMDADVILLGVPMHNFSIPAAFKAWIDQIARAGKTFSYGDQGPKGLVPAGKKVIIVLSRGGIVIPEVAPGGDDLQVAYLRKILGFLGLTDVTFVHADRQGMGAEAAKLSAESAIQYVTSLARSHTVTQAA